MDRVERRRAVRMRPTADCAATAAVLFDGKQVPIPIVDVSISGIALETGGPLTRSQPGDQMKLFLSLNRYGEHTVNGIVRYIAPAITGFELVELEPPAKTALRRYVAELLERGALS